MSKLGDYFDIQDYEPILKEIESTVTRDHPFIQYYIDKADDIERTGHGFLLTDPTMAVSERFMLIYKILDGDFNQAILKRSGWNEEQAYVLKVFLLVSLYKASTYLLRDRIIPFMAAHELPNHIVSRSIMPSPSMYITTEISGVLVPNLDTDIRWGSVLVMIGDVGIMTVWFGGYIIDEEKGYLSSHNAEIIYRRFDVIDKPYPSDSETLHFKFMLQLFAFMKSKISSNVLIKPTRVLRRRVQKMGMPNTDLNVNVFNLREKINPSTNLNYDNKNKLEHDYRWIVQGHYRAQWYPSEQAHHLIWIDEFFKGPEDKPIKPIKPRVYTVGR